jgi:hypothetical protein
LLVPSVVGLLQSALLLLKARSHEQHVESQHTHHAKLGTAGNTGKQNKVGQKTNKKEDEFDAKITNSVKLKASICPVATRPSHPLGRGDLELRKAKSLGGLFQAVKKL